jgi:cold shock CspA family protein
MDLLSLMDDSKDVFLHLKELQKIGLNGIDTGQDFLLR